MTGGVSRFWSELLLGKFNRGVGGYVFDLVFVALYSIVMCGFEKFSICLSRFE